MPLPTADQPPTQNILITGAAGLVGPLLAARLLSTPQYRLLLTDLADPIIPPNTAHPHHATTLQGDITSPEFITTLLTHDAIQPLHAVFLFHGIMSAAAEANPSLSLKVNVDSMRHLTDALASHHPGVRVIYASSLAVFGPPFPNNNTKVPPHWAPTPNSTYGAHKLLTEVYLNETHRRGALDVFVARFPTISVRPGKPTGAASSFLSGIIREPMNGVECVVPLNDRGFRAFLATPRTVVENLVRVLGWESGVLPAHARQVLFPGVAVSVQELRDALAKYGGEERLALIREVEDEGLERILRGWAEDYDIGKSLRLGLVVDESADGLVRDPRTTPTPLWNMKTALSLLNPLPHLSLFLTHPLWSLLEHHLYALPNPPPPRKRTHPMQVLCVGLPRTGTESLQQALLRLGYDHTYHGWDIIYDDAGCYSPGWVALARKKWFSTGVKEKRKGAVITAAEFDELLGHSVAVTDAAGSVFAAEMIAAYPEAKVVLNMRRDLDGWERSLNSTLVHANESWGFWIASWLDREAFWAWHVYERFLWPLLFRAPDGDMKRAIRGNARWVQREHANMVRGLVPKDRLLEWYIEDGWAPLCAFLGKPVPDAEFPHANAVGSGWKAREEQANKRWVERAFLNLILLGLGLVVSVVVARVYLF
ncbi:hypothetical protein C8A01DRAFT_49753 [Parachaetomium inaequale]|uniref:NAD-dependent epimerase/dehydratase domain-containing protein n=1 Tax=Parachaetomium inaequale TaxID=2588326 RepID=A0AAN6P8I6_9PEZI|nr:hypothetical protein C8A01DRAFT_49753 [Parachaetomium inaequale]